MADDVTTILADDNFKGLPLDQKHQVMLKVDPNYAGLPPKEQATALNAIHYGAPAQQPSEGVGGAFLNDVGDAIKGAGAALVRPYTEAYKGYQADGVSGAVLRGVNAAIHPTGTPGEAAANTIQGDRQEAADGRSLPYRAAAATARTIGVMDPAAQEAAANRGDTAGVVGHTILPLATATLPVAASEGMRAFDQHVLMPRRVISGKTNLLDALKVPGGKGGAALGKMENEIHIAHPDLAVIERNSPVTDKGAEAFQQTADNINDYRNQLWDQGHTAPVKRHAEMPFVGKPVLDAGDRAIFKTDDPEKAAPARAWLQRNVGTIDTLADADQKVRLINDELSSSEGRTYGPVQKRVMMRTVEALRDQIDSQLQDAGETGVKDLNQRWGALRSIEARLRERYAQEAPKDARAGLTPDWLREYAFWHGGMPAVGLSMRVGKAMLPTEGGRLTGALQDLANTNLQPAPTVTPSYVGKRPIALLPAAGQSSQTLTPMERGPQGATNQTPPSLAQPAIPTTTALARRPGSAPVTEVPPTTRATGPIIPPPPESGRVVNPSYQLPSRAHVSANRDAIFTPPPGSPTGKFETPRNTLGESGAVANGPRSAVPANPLAGVTFEQGSGIHYAVAPDGVRVSYKPGEPPEAILQRITEQRAMQAGGTSSGIGAKRSGNGLPPPPKIEF